MDSKTKQELRQFLEGERDRLRAEIEEFERVGHTALSDMSGENNYRDHMADQGTATFSRELDLTLEDNARKMLAEVEQALERLANGDYGLCRRCGEAIALERLKAMPSAELCVPCKAWEESA
ncbi:MAG: TraR/DksA C4-type zinc finger protein [Coriobacteriia bacterium]|nr:TraR/DksA C4-type zinc finger protein [Coriobacteriia bacterium]